MACLFQALIHDPVWRKDSYKTIFPSLWSDRFYIETGPYFLYGRVFANENGVASLLHKILLHDLHNTIRHMTQKIEYKHYFDYVCYN